MPGVVAFIWVMSAAMGINQHNQNHGYNQWRAPCHTLFGPDHSKDPGGCGAR